MSKSLDTAGLAAGRVALNDDAEDIAWSYFTSNFAASGGSASVDRDDFEFELSPDGRFVTLSVLGNTPTLFMRIFGRDLMTVSARTRIERETTGMELALVLDNTGSMLGSGFNAMQAATYDLVNILYGDESEIEHLWVSLVPYTATVNIGNSRTSWLHTSDRVRTGTNNFPSTSRWKGCVEARSTLLDTGDTPPTDNASRFRSFYYASTSRSQDNRWGVSGYPIKQALRDYNDGRGPNLGCGPPITPLTKSRATIEAAIGNMGPWHRGGTTGNLGLSWGWRTISPKWQGFWGGETPGDMPLAYGTPFMDKVVVILTDGQNQFYDHDTGALPRSDFTAYGRLEDALAVTSLGAGRNILDARMRATCAAMKAEGIRIYTITFLSPDTQAQNLFRDCATSPAMYEHAPRPEDLRDVFRRIGGQLANLRIVE